MSLELSTQCGIPMGLEQHLIEMGIIPPTPLAEISKTAVTRDSYVDLPSYDEETEEYLF